MLNFSKRLFSNKSYPITITNNAWTKLEQIFNANKTSDECHLSFVDDGLLRLIFRSEDENIDSTYFVVRKADY